MWSLTPAPVRNLHVLLNSSRVSSFFRRVLDIFKHDRFLWNLKLKLIVIKWTHQKCDQGPPPQSGTPVSSWTPAECHHSSGGFLMASNMTDLYENLNLSLLSSNDHIKNVIKDPSPSQEPPRPPELQQCHHSSGWFLITSNMLDFYETWNLI